MINHSYKARIDLLEIWAYIAEDSTNAADKLLDLIDDKCNLLDENAELGQARSDIAEGMRYLPVKNYLILYQVQPFGIEIVRVVHGSRDIDAIFASN